MKSETGLWCSKEEWKQVELTLKQAADVYPEKISALTRLADQITGQYQALDKSLEMLCRKTCLFCNDICCSRASLWYDFKDLMYYFFQFNEFPENQIHKKPLTSATKNHENACCHLTPKGCHLPRNRRPFVCTWYLCPPQKKTLYTMPHHRRLAEDTISQLKMLRSRMEDLFIQTVAS